MLLQQKIQKQHYDHQLLQTQIEVQEATFSSLGRELHDNIGQLIGSAKWLVGLSRLSPSNLADLLAMVDDTLGKAADEMRALSKSVNKEWLEKFDLIENLQTEIKRIGTATSIHVGLTLPDKIFLSADEQIILFRIIQEALQNSIKHAGAQAIDIIIKDEGSLLNVCIKDNGRGFSESKGQSNGQGLMNMRKRTELLGGTIAWNAKLGNGCAIEIKIPLKQVV